MIAISVYDDQREIKHHGTYAFPLAVYHYVMSDCMLGFINWHWHEEIQLTVVTHGTICFSADGQQYRIQEGEGFFINSKRLHMAKPEQDPDSSYLCLDFHPRLLSSFAGSIFEEKYVAPYLNLPEFSHLALTGQGPEQQEILRAVCNIADLMDQSEFGYELEVAACVSRLWVRLLSLMKASPAEPERFAAHHDTAQEIISYLRTHYREPVSLRDIARAVGFSESECCRLFKRVTGQTINRYLRSCRLTKSIELLEETDLPVGDISFEAGFNGASYFIECFRKELGKTPLEYRRERR